MAFNLAVSFKSGTGRLKLAHVHHNIVLNVQSLDDELSGALRKVAFITWLTATLWMHNRLIENDCELAFSCPCLLEDTQYSIPLRSELEQMDQRHISEYSWQRHNQQRNLRFDDLPCMNPRSTLYWSWDS